MIEIPSDLHPDQPAIRIVPRWIDAWFEIEKEVKRKKVKNHE